MSEFARFILVGLLNTAWGYLIIFGFMYVLAWSPEASNAAGYGIGLVTSYLLNRIYTFRSKNRKRYEFGRFLFVFAVAFAANMATLYTMVRWLVWNPYYSQILAGGIYVITSYLLNRAFVFKQCKIDVCKARQAITNKIN